MQRRVRQGLELVLAGGSEVSGERTYIIERHLGSGAFSGVYLATSGRLRLAVKEYNLHGPVPPEQVEDVIARELTALRAVGDHEMIPGLVEHFREGHYVYVVRRYVEGDTLADLLFLQGVLTGYQITQFGIGMGMALDHLHRQGYLLVDLKPDNVIVDHSQVPHIVDLGSVLALEAGMEEIENFLVTEGYYAPELAAAKGRLAEVHPVLDVFALGAVLYELATGRRLELRAVNELGRRHLEPLFARQELPHTIVGVIGRALSRDPGRRYGSLAEMVEELREGVAPCMEIYPSAIEAGPVAAGEMVTGRLVAYNLGGEVLMGEVTPSAPWMDVRISSRAELHTNRFRGNREEVMVRCKPPMLARGSGRVEAYVQVESQTAAARVPVRLEVEAEPGAVEPEEERIVLRATEGEGARKDVWVRNMGEGEVECRLLLPEGLPLEVRPPMLRLGGGREGCFHLDLRAGRLPVGGHVGTAFLQFGALRVSLEMEVTVEAARQALGMRLWRRLRRRQPRDRDEH